MGVALKWRKSSCMGTHIINLPLQGPFIGGRVEGVVIGKNGY
jgi:hypothetical protein